MIGLVLLVLGLGILVVSNSVLQNGEPHPVPTGDPGNGAGAGTDDSGTAAVITAWTGMISAVAGLMASIAGLITAIIAWRSRRRSS